MHGKIMIYIDSTERGTVVDLKKTFFDFNRQSWHDKKSIPSVGTYVEFTADSANRITSLRPSKYQEFKEGEFYTESDFWRTESDFELENIEQAKRAEYVMQLYRTTDFNTLDHIPLSVTIPQAIQAYYRNEFLAVDGLEANMEALENKPPLVLNYFILKKFLAKALDTLFYMDSSINQSQFSNILNTTTRLEASYNDMKERQKNINITRIFNEIFLPVQCYYQALLVAIDSRKNRIKNAQYQLRSCRMEINFETQKPKPNQERIASRREKITKLTEEMTEIQKSIERLENLRDEFLKNNLKGFEQGFKLAKERLFQRITKGLDLCITITDAKLWTLSLDSTGLKNSYYTRSNTYNSFCSFAFAELYLSRLDKYLLSENDQKLYSYVQNIIKQYRKKFLIVSSDEEFITDLKIKIFKLSPYHFVKSAMKEVNFQQMMHDESFDIVYIDENTAWENTADIILKGKGFDRYERTKFKVV